MASVISEFRSTSGPAGSIHVVYFSEDDGTVSRLAAAVVWRSPPVRRRRLVRGWLRRLRFRLGPLGAGFSIGRGAGHWTGAAGADGEQETLYHRSRRVVRVLGREHALPDPGRTLVLLVDEAAAGAPIVTRHVMTAPSTTPAEPEPPQERSPDGAPDEAAVWAKALRQDPVVQAFMAPRA